MAWVESVNGGTDFQERQHFLTIWHSSPYDFTIFSSSNKNKMRKALIKLGKDKPPVDGDPLKFFTLCRQGDIQKNGFDKVGPAMAMHYLLAHEKMAKEEKEKKEEEERKKDEVVKEKRAVMKATLLASIAACDAEADTIEGDVDEEEEDEMEVNVGGPVDVPEDVYLTRVPWDLAGFKAPLNIDVEQNGARLESDRIPWIDQKDACDTIINPVDDLTDILKRLGL